MESDALFWRQRRVFVTGAAGLLGPALVGKLLACGAEVFVLLRDAVPNSLLFLNGLDKKVTVAWGDLCDFELLQRLLNEWDIEVVFHLGAQPIVGFANRSPLSTFKSNIEGTWNLLEACRLSPWVKRIVVASSDKAYGAQTRLPYTEETPLEGRHPYDVSKSCADLLAQSYFHTYKLPVCVTRCGNFFGPGDLHFNRIIPGTIQSVLQGKRPVIRSNGLFVRDYIYVLDVVDAYMALAEQMDKSEVVGQSFNFSTDEPFTVLEIVQKVLESMNCTFQPIVENRASNEIPAQHLLSTKAQNLLGWKACYGVTRGLEQTISWYKKFFEQNEKSLEQLHIPHFTNYKETIV